jgi:hypothetical protein
MKKGPTTELCDLQLREIQNKRRRSQKIESIHREVTTA